MRVHLSAIIITYNEETKIQRCITSLQAVAEDIVVVDSFSKDQTKQICKENGVRFFENEFTSYANQKNFAVSLAKYDHILSLDADEYLSEELTESIQKLKENWNGEAYKMNRMSAYGGKWIKHGNWYPDGQIRLWNKNYGKWGGENPHEKILLEAGIKVSKINGDLLHESYDNCAETLEKVQLYSEIFAQSNVLKKPIGIWGILVHTGFAFFKSYFLKRGFLDGYEGLAVAMSVTNHTFYKYAKLYEANIIAVRSAKNSKADITLLPTSALGKNLVVHS